MALMAFGHHSNKVIIKPVLVAKIVTLSQIDNYLRGLERIWLKNIKYFGLKYGNVGSNTS